MAWTDERIAKLKHGWESGMTATQIAELLGEGVTRNAVIGKAHRLGLESRPSPVKATDGSPAPAGIPANSPVAAAPPAAAPARPAPAPAAAPAPTAAPTPTAAAIPAAAPPAPRTTAKAKSGKQARTTLLDLNEKVCKWPIGHPGEADFHFCGKGTQPGFPYCNEHCLIAYQAQVARRDRPRQLPTTFGPIRK
ncbi:GcrA family cell cycle regulator [Sandarakinorhabdus sp.]|jgi:GcrA cell cycle regulator|uniref:GcrA family cell cycle regulator n=1 Tax=Sandarakinorhabdus sp. TaxID=1916663 RepID=UPI0033418125